MNGEQRTAIIDLMAEQKDGIARLQANKARLTQDLRVEVKRIENSIASPVPKARAKTLQGISEGTGILIGRAVSTLPMTLWKGHAVDYDADKASAILSGSNKLWTTEAQTIAKALAYTNKLLRKEHEKIEKEKEKKDIAATKKEIAGSQQSSYSRLVQIYNDMSKPGVGRPSEDNTYDDAAAQKWREEQLQFIKSLSQEAANEIRAYGLENNRWAEDFKE